MKRGSIVVCLVGVLFFVGFSNATLIDNGDGTITQIRDDGKILMWFQNANSFGIPMTWERALFYANDAGFAGYYDWRLPSALNTDGSGPCSGYNCYYSEMGYLYYKELGNSADNMTNIGPFKNLIHNFYWTSIEWAQDNNYVWVFSLYDTGYGYQGYTAKHYDLPVWIVRDAGFVPEPVSFILFVTGGAVLAGRRYLRRKNNS